MCLTYLSRRFVTFSLCNKSYTIINFKAAKTRVSNFNFSKPYSELNSVSTTEFDLLGVIKSRYKIDYQSITEGNASKIKELELLIMKLELKIQEGFKLPKIITTDHWRTLLTLSEEEMQSFVQYRLAVETLAASEKKERMEAVGYFESNRSSKGVFNAAILEREPYLYDFNSLQAMLYGPHVVIDCGFEKVIPRSLIWGTAYHMFEAWLKNRNFCNPSHIIYCNLNPDGEFYSLIMEMFDETNHDPTFSFSWTRKSYLDLFPKEDLIYLSPDSKNTMQKYNGKKVYIIGGISKFHHVSLTYKKAKLEEIQTAKLPLDEYVNWGCGPKKLSVNQCVNLLNDLKEGCSWHLAFRHIPKNSWARHAMDENTLQTYYKFKKPKQLIHKNYRDDFINNLNS